MISEKSTEKISKQKRLTEDYGKNYGKDFKAEASNQRFQKGGMIKDEHTGDF